MLQIFSFQRVTRVVGLILLLGALGLDVRAQEATTGRPVLDVDGNKVFSKVELLEAANKCLDQAVKDTHKYEADYLDYCQHRVLFHMQEKGYLQARLGKILYKETDSGLKATIPVEEGALYRVGQIEIVKTRMFSPAQVRDMIGLKTGDIANGETLSSGIFERVKEAYSNFGYIQYSAEVTPEFHLKDTAEEGVADFKIEIDEGEQFRIRSIKFAGGDKSRTDLLQRELMVRDGEVFNSDLWRQSIIRMNNTGLFDPIDIDKDVDFTRKDEKAPLMDLTIHLKKTVASTVP